MPDPSPSSSSMPDPSPSSDSEYSYIVCFVIIPLTACVHARISVLLVLFLRSQRTFRLSDNAGCPCDGSLFNSPHSDGCNHINSVVFMQLETEKVR